MSDSVGVVAVDVGNSAVKLCVRAAENRLLQHALPLTQPDWTAAAVQWTEWQHAERPVQWRIASVHRVAAERLSEAVDRRGPDHTIHRVSWRHVPLPARVDHPDRLGIDRLLGAWAATREFDGPVAAVDIGSAITVDWADRHRGFLGGAILPGLAMQCASLAAGTEALPHLMAWSSDRPVAIPAKSTDEAIRLGVLAGVAGAIDRLIELYMAAEESAGQCTVVLTGGGAAMVAPQLRHTHAYRPHLICQGLLGLPLDNEAAAG